MEWSRGSENRGADVFQKLETGIKTLRQTKWKHYLSFFFFFLLMRKMLVSPRAQRQSLSLAKFFENLGSLVAQMVKKLPAMQETPVPWVGKFSWRKEMAIHSSILAWIIPLTEDPGWLQSVASQRVRHYWAAKTFTFTFSGNIIWSYALSQIPTPNLKVLF